MDDSSAAISHLLIKNISNRNSYEIIDQSMSCLIFLFSELGTKFGKTEPELFKNKFPLLQHEHFALAHGSVPLTSSRQ
jgi:hypothetical protein